MNIRNTKHTYMLAFIAHSLMSHVHRKVVFHEMGTCIIYIHRMFATIKKN